MRRLSPGELLVCDADRPFLRGFSGGLEELVLKVPGDLFCEVTGLGGPSAPRVVGFGPPGTRGPPAGPAGRAAAREDGPNRCPRPRCSTSSRPSPGSGPGPRSGPPAAALAYVDAHLLEPGLTVERVAAAVGLSPRHLSRVLAEGGTTFQPHLRARRLEAARRLLLDPDAADLGVAQVARRCGFASPRHFATAFAAAYGEPPSEVRRRAARARAVDPASAQRPSVPAADEADPTRRRGAVAVRH